MNLLQTRVCRGGRPGAMLALIVCAAVRAVAQSESAAAPEPPGEPPAGAQRIQGALTRAGVSMGLSAAFEAFHASYPGSNPDRGARGLSDLDVRWNLPGFLHRATFAGKYSLYWQSGPAADPTMQGFSNLTADSFHRWREAYIEAPVGSATRIKLGKVDANTEFAVIQNASDFSNSSAGVSPALFTMPSYPYGAPSVNVFFAFTPAWSGGTGFYRTPDGGLYTVTELSGRVFRRRSVRLAGGFWTQSVQNLEAGTVPQTTGAYFVYEQTVLPLTRSRGLRAFTRVSTADATVAPASTHLAYGVTWTGVGKREHDSAGFAVFHLVPALDGQHSEIEKAYEFYYRIPIGKRSSLKADLQRIHRPGCVPVPPGTVASVRFLINVSTQEVER